MNGTAESGPEGETLDTHERPQASRQGLIARERLVSRLLAPNGAPIATLVAPAGYGKTTVLSEWGLADRRPFAWVSLDDRHNDPAFLLASIARTLNEIEPIDGGVFAALSAPRPSIENVVIPRLADSLGEREHSFVVVLDDVHRLQEPESLTALLSIAERVPRGSRLALASRAEPPIPVGRLRAHGQILELRAQDLVMNRAEAHQLLRASGIELSREAVDRLLERTEGWPVAIYLAALTLQGEDDLDLAVKAFAGDHRMIADYLREEFLSGLPPADRAFLTRTSVLDRLSGPVCDAVLEREGSAERLRDLSRSNLLLVALDRRDQEYRYHSLLRRMLRSELSRSGERPEAELHGRASGWYAGHGDFDRAVPHAISAGDVQRAADLIWRITPDYASSGREATVRRWVERFTPEQIAATPALSLAYATSHLSRGDGYQVEHWTSAAVHGLENVPRSERKPLEVGATVIRQTGAARDGVAWMGEEVARAYELLPEDSPWRAVCCLVEGVARHLQGNRKRAWPRLEEAVRRGAVAAPSIEMISRAQLALLALDERDPDSAADFADRALNGVLHYGLIDDSPSALTFALSALLRARRGLTGKATRDVKHATRLLGTFADFTPWYETETRIVLARALVLLDDVVGARRHLADAAGYLRQVPDATVLDEWLEEAWKEATSTSANGRWPLTAAELRLLHLLPTHLSFREIAGQFVVSTNTVKTQAQAIYRKLGAASRAEAVSSARAGGLLGESEGPPQRPQA